MKQRIDRATLALILTISTWPIPRAWAAGPIVVVISSDSAPYQEALAGVKETAGQPVTVINLANLDKIPQDAGVVITIGGKAAVHSYSNRTPMVYCVSPGVFLDPGTSTLDINIYVAPPLNLMFSKLLELQPGLKHLGMLWVTEAPAYFRDIQSVGKRQGIDVILEQVSAPGELPDRLRSLKGKVDALWLPPDPLLITPQNFGIMKQFALDNDIPLYVPMDGLADKGATAALFVSFHEMGRKAGAVAAQVLAGSIQESTSLFADMISVTINPGAAAQSGLKIPEAVLRKADRVVP